MSKEDVRLIDAYALKKRAVKVMFRDSPESGEFYAVGICDIDIMPTIDPDTLRPGLYSQPKISQSAPDHGLCGGGIRMTQLQEAIRDKITKYSDACGMCTDTTKECDTCGITCVLEELNELQKLANNPDAVRPTAKWVEAPDEGADGSWEACSLCAWESRWAASQYKYCPHCGARMVNADD